jgi:hypothetical protein
LVVMGVGHIVAALPGGLWAWQGAHAVDTGDMTALCCSGKAAQLWACLKTRRLPSNTAAKTQPRGGLWNVGLRGYSLTADGAKQRWPCRMLAALPAGTGPALLGAPYRAACTRSTAQSFDTKRCRHSIGVGGECHPPPAPPYVRNGNPSASSGLSSSLVPGARGEHSGGNLILGAKGVGAVPRNRFWAPGWELLTVASQACWMDGAQGGISCVARPAAALSASDTSPTLGFARPRNNAAVARDTAGGSCRLLGPNVPEPVRPAAKLSSVEQRAGPRKVQTRANCSRMVAGRQAPTARPLRRKRRGLGRWHPRHPRHRPPRPAASLHGPALLAPRLGGAPPPL